MNHSNYPQTNTGFEWPESYPGLQDPGGVTRVLLGQQPVPTVESGAESTARSHTRPHPAQAARAVLHLYNLQSAYPNR